MGSAPWSSLRGRDLNAVLSLPSLPAHGGQPPARSEEVLIPDMPQALHMPWSLQKASVATQPLGFMDI